MRPSGSNKRAGAEGTLGGGSEEDHRLEADIPGTGAAVGSPEEGAVSVQTHQHPPDDFLTHCLEVEQEIFFILVSVVFTP